MSNQIQLQQRIRHVAEELEKGTSKPEIVNNGMLLWSVSERTMDTYIALAKDIVMGNIKQADAIIEAVRGAVIAEGAEQNLRSNMELESKLVSIIEGELALEKVISKSGGDYTEIRSVPSKSQIIRAIDIIWRRRGLYKQNAPPAKEQEEMRLPTIVVESNEQKQLVEKVFKLP